MPFQPHLAMHPWLAIKSVKLIVNPVIPRGCALRWRAAVSRIVYGYQEIMHSGWGGPGLIGIGGRLANLDSGLSLRGGK